MIKGLELFRLRFADYADNYVLIGGAACDVLLEHAALPFRATRDLDIVLCVEALTPEFGRAFWNFVRDGGYEIQEKSSGERKLYRFRKPATPEFPEMLELFSRRPDAFTPHAESQLTPISIDDEVSSLSAILLDDDYYQLIQAHKRPMDGLSLLSAESLIVLKAKAYLDLSARKERGEAVDAKNIRKHKNDICRLFAALTAQSRVALTPGIHSEVALFIERLADEPVDLRALGLPFTMPEVIVGLRRTFTL
jgi:hypothetical protein